MGVFLYSNSTNIDTERIEKVFSSRGHKVVNSYKRDSMTLVHSGKILTSNKGILTGKDLNSSSNDFIVGIGTFFYKGKFGDDALKQIWEDLDSIIEENTVYGHWAFVVHKNNVTYVFNDMSGTLRLYYIENNDSIIVSSSLTATIASIPTPRFDKVRLGANIAARFGREVPFVEGIEDVDSLQYLYIKDAEKPIWKKRKISTVEHYGSLDKSVDYVKTLFDEQINQLKAIGEEKISVELTGGLDSRLITANLKTAGFNYDFISYPIYGPDQEMAKMISQKLNKRLLQQTNIHLTSEFDKHIGEFDFGANFFRQYANPRWNIENRIQFNGALGECLSTPNSLDWLNDTRIDNLLRHLVGGTIINKEIREQLIQYLVSFFNRRGFSSEEKLTEKEVAMFEEMLLGELSGDYRYNSGCQACIYFYNIYTEWHFNHFVTDISFDVKNGRKLTLALIKAIDPEVGGYPFLSRLHTKGQSVNETRELPLRYFSYLKFKTLCPKGLLNYLYERKGHKFDKKKLSDINFDLYSEVVNTKELQKYPNLHFEELNKIYSLEVLRKHFGIQ